jgi:hypothetical protein
MIQRITLSMKNPHRAAKALPGFFPIADFGRKRLLAL